MNEDQTLKKVLILGGAGYIGTHVVIEMLANKHTVCVVDDFSNSKEEGLENITTVTGISFSTHRLNVCDYTSVKTVFMDFKPEVVIHLAGVKDIGESNLFPLKYYQTNILASINVLKAMSECGCNKLLFSSSASVYKAQSCPLDELQLIEPINPYSQSKYFIEEIVRDWVKIDPKNSAVIFRYFNPAGRNKYFQVGDTPKKKTTNLFPLIKLAVSDPRNELEVFGSNYDTLDGTPVRDYVHVVDIARAHSNAILFGNEKVGFEIFNLGSNTGYSVLEIIDVFERVSGKKVPHKFTGRRDGDVPHSVADSSKAEKLLNWMPQLGIEAMCEDEWNW